MPVVKLTDAFVKAAKCAPGMRVSEFRDADVRGLELRVWATGAKAWRLHYTAWAKGARPASGDADEAAAGQGRTGARRVIALGRYESQGDAGLSLKAARAKARALRGSIEDAATRADPMADRQTRRQARTFGEIAADWIRIHGMPNKSAGALRDNQGMLDRHILPAIGGMRAAEITKSHVIEMLDTVAAKPDARIKPEKKSKQVGRKVAPVAPRKLTHQPNRVFELVRSIFRWSVGRDLLKVDPTWGLPPPIRKEKPRERDLSPDEIRQLWVALDRAPVSRRYVKGLPRGERVVGETDIPLTRATALTLKLALATAQRIGEVAGIATAELDLNDTAPVWTIPGERAKNGQANRVPLSPIALELIREAIALAPAGSQWLFPNAGGDGSIYPHAPTKALERARPAIGLADFRVHDLRRTAATRMAEMGVAPHTISLVLNHVSARSGTITGKVYVQYSYDREKREALGAWGTRLERIVAGADGANVLALVR